MTKKTKKTVLLGLIIAIAAGAGFAYYLWNKPHRAVEDGIKVVAAELLNQYVQDSVAANKKYTDKVVEITGEVADTATNLQNEPVIKLKTTQEGAFINCTFEEKGVTANPGIKISVMGICDGYSGGDADMGLPGDVVIRRCHLVK